MSFAAFIPLIGNVIDKIFPDKDEAAKAKYKLAELHAKGELAFLDANVQLALGQMAINKEEAKHINWFVAGGRPFIMWICGIGLSYQFLLQPIAAWVSAIYQVPVPPPVDGTSLFTILGGLLGLGGLRTYEKFKGVNKRH